MTRSAPAGTARAGTRNRAPDGRSATMVVRVGGDLGNVRFQTSFSAGKSEAFFRYTVVDTTWLSEVPAAASLLASAATTASAWPAKSAGTLPGGARTPEIVMMLPWRNDAGNAAGVCAWSCAPPINRAAPAVRVRVQDITASVLSSVRVVRGASRTPPYH